MDHGVQWQTPFSCWGHPGKGLEKTGAMFYNWVDLTTSIERLWFGSTSLSISKPKNLSIAQQGWFQ